MGLMAGDHFFFFFLIYIYFCTDIFSLLSFVTLLKGRHCVLQRDPGDARADPGDWITAAFFGTGSPFVL